ncbi:MAG: DUF4258 domain-containing protein [Gemmatimonadetes bacterium]|nr:DUF4258 domain-containing protein [Gemmatimonadota bacterium]
MPADDPTVNPLRPPAAKALARDIAENGVVEFSAHALDEMAKDGLDTTDCLNLLRGGVFRFPEVENREWRYRVSTSRMSLVFAFRPRHRLRVVTAWRNRP